MKLGDLMSCALPVLSQYDSEEYPYFFGGTCFLVRFGGRLFVVTARHVLNNRPLKDVFIPRRPTSRTFLSLRHAWFAPGELLETEDPDQYDWAIIQADDPGNDEEDPLATTLDLDAVGVAKLTTIPESHKLVVRGFPDELSAINFDALRIEWKAFAGTGAYHRAATWDHCHTLLLDEPEAVKNYSGLSGSPVFLVWPADAERFHVQFAGMTLRGGNGFVHFLSALVLVDALRKCK